MNSLKNVLTLAVCLAATGLGVQKASAQGFRNMSPEEIRAQMTDGIRTRLDIKDDTEWTAIKPKIDKVLDAQRDVQGMRMGGMRALFAGRRNRNGGDNADNGGGNGGNNNRRGGGLFGGEPSASVEALQKALEDPNTSKDDLKAKLAAVRAEAKDKDAKLEAAQEDLKSVLTTRQEAELVSLGLLK